LQNHWIQPPFDSSLYSDSSDIKFKLTLSRESEVFSWGSREIRRREAVTFGEGLSPAQPKHQIKRVLLVLAVEYLSDRFSQGRGERKTPNQAVANYY